MGLIGASSVAKLLTGIFGGNGIQDAIDGKNKDVMLSGGNIITLLDKLIITPSIIVPKNIRHSEVIDKVIDNQLSTFAGLYGTALEHMVTVLGVELDTALSLLSSGRGVNSRDLGELTAMSFTGDNFNFDVEDFTVEDKKVDGQPLIKELTISFNKDKVSVRVNVIIRASITYVDESSLKLLLEDNDENATSFFNRLDEARSGLITWTDFFIPTDLIKKHRKRRLLDEDDLIKEMEEMSSLAHTKILTDGAIGFGKYYRMFIIDVNMKEHIRKVFKVPHNKGGANKFLDATNSLSLSLIDENQGVVETFMSNIKGSMVSTFKSLNKNSSNKQDDILAFLAGMGR